VYKRVYSKITVYEMIANGIPIMRRQEDGWINATHLLKVAGFLEKARRTKVLEREIQDGVHQKIQGGFGKYQGTW
ncbi:transcription regulator HTH, apses-type DNA-binding domain-containing protein, partial [Zopfochytrium polystomum]